MEETKFLEKYKKTVIKQSIKILLSKIKIDYTEEELFEILIQTNIKKRCVGITSTLKQCISNASGDLDYCKKHMFNYGLSNNSKSNSKSNSNFNLEVVPENLSSSLSLSFHENLKKKFIDDAFYYIDEHYIYDIKTIEKVGINYNGEFILSCDPFILGQC